MERLRVGVVGATGYSGAAVARRIEAHTHLTLAFGTSDRMAGESVASRMGVRLGEDLRFVSNGTAIDHADRCDSVVLATAAEVSLGLVPAFAERQKQVFDLSGAFRLDTPDYPRWYGFEHTAPHWLGRAHYGLPEIFGAPPKGAVVANPGCYPPASLLAVAPPLRAGLVEPAGIVVAAKSGGT